jgi:DNA-binding IscR family transcriptional regulator
MDRKRRRAIDSDSFACCNEYENITFLDVYRAVDCVENGELFHFHENPNRKCPVGRNIHRVLDEKLRRVQETMEREMEQITLADVIRDTRECIQSDPAN